MLRKPTSASARTAKRVSTLSVLSDGVGRGQHVVGQANIELDENGYIVNERNAARKAGEFILAHRDEIEFVSVAEAACFGGRVADSFLENDDANRALMGSNMQASRCLCCAQKRPTSARAWRV